MKLLVDIHYPAGHTECTWLDWLQSLHVGNSNLADLAIAGDDQMAPVHFAIIGSQAGWSVRRCAEAESFLVNGRFAEHERLKHGDIICAGKTRFQIRLEHPTSTPIDSPICLPTDAVATQPVGFRCIEWKSQVVEYRVDLPHDHCDRLLARLFAGKSAYSLVNRQTQAGKRIAIEPENDDLFAEAPDEIRKNNSLHLIPFDSADQTLVRSYWHAASHDAACLIASSLDQPTIRDQQKVYWAWFSRPSILKQQLRHGSKELAEKLLTGVDLVVLPSDDAEDELTLLAKSADREDWTERLQACSSN